MIYFILSEVDVEDYHEITVPKPTDDDDPIFMKCTLARSTVGNYHQSNVFEDKISHY